MDIKILDSWLKDYLDTKAAPAKIAECLSLCGPSIERVKKLDKDFVYSIEVTTNRVDTASVYGIAREASAILPRFKIPAKLKRIKSENSNFKFVQKVNYLDANVDSKLCPRFCAVLIRNVKIGDSSEIIKNRLESADVRSINNVVDISNYIMLALGQPVHTFDYDKIMGASMTLRESKKGEKITTLDNKTFTLSGGDIVIEDGEKRLIDLAGVMGGNLSSVGSNTKNVLLFVQTYDPVRIRKTSMSLAQRTQAATIFEKGTDPELVSLGMLEAINLFEKHTAGIAEKTILDIYPSVYKPKSVTTNIDFIESRLGVSISKKEITDILNSLEFESTWSGNSLNVIPPTFRAQDIQIQEDVVEEIARLYGYYNLPSVLMNGVIPEQSEISKLFSFETNVKNILSGWGGVEVYTLSLVPESYTKGTSLKLKNPLGSDTEYLRTSLMPSLVSAANDNKGTYKEYHLFEISNVYIPQKNDIPEERLMLAGIFEGYDFRNAKGVIEALLEKIKIKSSFEVQENDGYAAGQSASISVDGKTIGSIGYVEDSSFVYYEFEMQKLLNSQQKIQYKEISKFPAQIEDVTIVFPEKTKIGEVVESITSTNRFIENIELRDIFDNAFTFRVRYQDSERTLTNVDVEKIRSKILEEVKSKFGGTIKS